MGIDRFHRHVVCVSDGNDGDVGAMFFHGFSQTFQGLLGLGRSFRDRDGIIRFHTGKLSFRVSETVICIFSADHLESLLIGKLLE